MCGDNVTIKGETVSSVSPRRTSLTVTGPHGETRVLAANLDVLCIVLAHIPRPLLTDWEGVAATAASGGVTPLWILNKVDLPDSPAWVKETKRELQGSAIEIMEISAMSGIGIEDLSKRLDGRVAALCGVSGAGKSQTTRALGASEAAVRALGATGRGRHMTTTARMYPLNKGWLIDLPGRDRFLWHDMSDTGLRAVFPDVTEHAADCKFRNCEHRDIDHGCAVQAAVTRGELQESRVLRLASLRQRRETLLTGRRDQTLKSGEQPLPATNKFNRTRR